MALRVSSITETDTSSKSDSKSKEHSESQSKSESLSTTKKLLDSDLMNQILGGLMKNMTDEELTQFADNLLRPQLNAALEESRQNYETTKLSKEQELENLAASLTRAIDEQNTAYRKSAANVETAALSRGMGRSSYTLQTLANQGDALAKAVQQLTDESTRQSGQIQKQITQAFLTLYDAIADKRLLQRRLTLTADLFSEAEAAAGKTEQLDFFTAPVEKQAREEELEREQARLRAMLEIKKKFGKNAIFRGMNLEEGATARDRNSQIGGHKA